MHRFILVAGAVIALPCGVAVLQTIVDESKRG
jgi:hypothetical protein